MTREELLNLTYEEKRELIRQSKHLDVFIDDEDALVRETIAKYGYGLDKLINDENKWVRLIAQEQLKELKPVEEDKLFNLEFEDKIELIKQGKYLDIFIKAGNPLVRLAIAEQGYKLDVLINDKSEYVRAEVANKGYRLDILINDGSAYVREAVAKQGYGLDILINDEDEFVRMAVAEQGYGLDILINDEHEWVRGTVEDKLEELNRLKNISNNLIK